LRVCAAAVVAAAPRRRAGGALRPVRLEEAVRAAGFVVLAALVAFDRSAGFAVRPADFAVRPAGFAVRAAGFFAVVVWRRDCAAFFFLPVRPDVDAALRAELRRVLLAALAVDLRPPDRAPARELFRAAFLVLPAALRLAIVCSFGAPI
jgi:hypothetical protein